MRRVNRSVLVALLLGATFSLPHFSLVDDYGVAWDEALGDLFFGQRYLSWWTTLDPTYLDFAGDPYPPDHTPDLRLSPLRLVPHEHYPVASTLAAATSAVLNGAGLLDPLDGYHGFNLVLSFFFVVAFYFWLSRREGDLYAAAATLLLMTLPRVFYHQMVNIKDFPEMVFFTLSLFAFVSAAERDSLPRYLLAGVLWGLALGTKANALFVPVIALLWLAVRGVPKSWQARARAVSWLPIGGIVFIASWPWLWPELPGRLWLNLSYILGRGTGGEGVAQAHPLWMILWTTPLLVIVAILIGLVTLLRRRKTLSPVDTLALVWATVVLVRILLPGAVNFDGVRHFLELFPALAMIAASGIVALTRSARLGNRQELAAAITIPLVIAPSIFGIVSTHPFQSAYWNRLIGGLHGAVERGVAQSSDYWATSYRQGIDWLNRNAEENAVLVVPIAQHTVVAAAPIRLRTDIRILPVSRFWTPEVRPGDIERLERTVRERPVYGMTVLRRDWWNEIAERIERSERTAEWRVDDEPLLIISRLEPEPPTRVDPPPD